MTIAGQPVLCKVEKLYQVVEGDVEGKIKAMQFPKQAGWFGFLTDENESESYFALVR